MFHTFRSLDRKLIFSSLVKNISNSILLKLKKESLLVI